MNCFKEFFGLKENGVYSIYVIERWLLKYSGLKKETHDYIYCQHKFQLENGSIVRLPPLGKKSEQEKFLDLYQALDTISQYHKNEKYFEQEINTYFKIKQSKADLKAWTSKNEDLGANKYVCFLLDYLDYDVDEKVEHLCVFVHSLKDLDIFVDRQDFKNTIEFLEIFNELYWVKEILPQNLKEIRERTN